jgi:hypothetical protein
MYLVRFEPAASEVKGKCANHLATVAPLTSFRDFLGWYNNLDVVPFLEAIEKMSEFWKERKIDMFKDGVSVPGLTMKYFFSNVAGSYFSLFSEKDKDLYYTMKDKSVVLV